MTPLSVATSEASLREEIKALGGTQPVSSQEMKDGTRILLWESGIILHVQRGLFQFVHGVHPTYYRPMCDSMSALAAAIIYFTENGFSNIKEENGT